MMSVATFAVTDNTKVKRKPARAHYEVASVHAILDAVLFAQVGFVLDSQPHIIPTAIWREHDWLYIHGSNGSRMLRQLAQGAPATVSATLLDGLVLARAAMHASINYRSVCLYGRFNLVNDPLEKMRQMQIFFDHILPGRWQEVRAPNQNELAAVTMLAMPIKEAVAKIRTGPPVDDAEDITLPNWAGVLPLHTQWGAPEAAPDLAPDIAVPDSIQRLFDADSR